MDRCGVDKAILADMHPYSFEWKIEMMAQYPDRLAAYACVNPKGGKATLTELERQVQEFEAIGVKLGPPYQHFYPNDTSVYPLYEKALDLDIPVAFHTGWAPGAARLKYALPIYLDDVASDFPKLKVIGCHMGAGWFHDFALVATKNPNIYADVSGCLEYTPITEIIQAIERLLQYIGADRILLGSDYPLFRLTTFLEIVQTLKLHASEKRKILGDNARKLFRLS
jgi:predicted TIM-barrel fold metal-dependent hydrolase